MKKLSIILCLLMAFVFAKAQNPIPADSTFPIPQSIANAPKTIAITNVMQAKKGFINGVFADTTAANAYSATATTGGYRLKYYPGAQIFTTTDTSLWVRNSNATKWIRPQSGGINITSFTFDNDTTGIICFSSGICDTFRIVNLFNVVTNIVQNFNDSTVFNINDSTLLICHGTGAARVCDTLHLGSSNTYFFITHGDSVFAKTCDTVQAICVGDSCYQQQLCDSILLSAPLPITVYQNGVWKNNNIVEMGVFDPNLNTPSDIFHETWLRSGSPLHFYSGTPSGTPFQFQMIQWTQQNTTITSWLHYGAYHPGWRLLDSSNTVPLIMNYTNPLVIPTEGALTGDTVGYVGNRYGYMLGTNFPLVSATAKQSMIFFDTYSQNNEGVSIIAQQNPSAYSFTSNGPKDSTFLSKRVVTFNTDQSSNFLGKVYLTNGRLEPDTALITAANNLTLGLGNVNLVSGATQINAITTSGWQAGSSPVYLVFSGAPLVKNNTSGGAGTATILLAGRTDFQAAAGDVLALLYNGTNWYETNRSLASGAGITGITADQGVKASTSTNVRLGGDNNSQVPFTSDRYINAGTHILFVNGTNDDYVINASTTNANATVITGVNSGGGQGVFGSGATGVNGSGTTTGVDGSSGSGDGVRGTITGGSGAAGKFTNQQTSTNTVLDILRLYRTTTGTAANGIGGSIEYYLETDDGLFNLSNSITSKLTTAAVATRTSQYIIAGVNNAVTQNLLTLAGSGQLTLDQYTTSNFNGGVAADSVLVVTSAGVVKKRNAAAFSGGGGGFTTADNGVNASTATNIQWGGSLLQNTSITDNGTHNVNFTNVGEFNVEAGDFSSNTGFLYVKQSTFSLNVADASFAGVGIDGSTGSMSIKGDDGSGNNQTGIIITVPNILTLFSKTAGNLKQMAFPEYDFATYGTVNYIPFTVNSVNAASTGEITLLGGIQGADVASTSGALTVLPLDGSVFELTGTNTITLITKTGRRNGNEITFVFTSTATLTDGTANSGSDIGMELAGGTNFTGSADDTITLVLTEIGGVQRWREKCRSVN